MSLLAVLALAQAAPAPATPAPLPPAVIERFNALAARLQQVKIEWAVSERGAATVIDRCTVSAGSGDAALDAIPCRILQTCVAAEPRGLQSHSPQFMRCMSTQRTLALARLTKARMERPAR